MPMLNAQLRSRSQRRKYYPKPRHKLPNKDQILKVREGMKMRLDMRTNSPKLSLKTHIMYIGHNILAESNSIA